MRAPLRLLLASSLLLLAPASAHAGKRARAEAPVADEPVEAAQAELPEEAGGVDTNPMLEAVAARLSAEPRALFEQLDEQGLGDIFERFDRGEDLTSSERAIVEAMQAQFLEEADAALRYQTGDIALRDGLATLHLGDEFRYLDPEQTENILVEAWGNPPGAQTLGMILPAAISPYDPEAGWGVVISYVEDGHVEDDDADDIDYDELLEEMKKDTESENPGRTAAGYPAMHLVGWAEPPHYQADAHRLYWAKELSAEGSPLNSLNYSIRVLGRKGVLELNAVAGMPQLSDVKPEMENLLSKVEFDAGNRYTDFDPDIDSVAAYGIGGLIAGKLLAKAGFFAVILKFLIAAKKLLIVGAIALAAGVKALLGWRKKNDDVA